MGCDWGVSGHVPYCKPKCKEFALVTSLEKVKAQCVRCGLHHDFTVVNGKIKIIDREKNG